MKNVGLLSAAVGLFALASSGAQAAPTGVEIAALKGAASEAATVQKTTFGWHHRRYRHYGYAPYWGSGYGYYYRPWSYRWHRHHYHRRGWHH